MNIPETLKYTKEHEWAKREGDLAIIGITDYAQKELGDIVYIELPSVGKKTEVMKPCATIEAVKTVADVYAPFTGEVVEVNQELATAPQLLNQDPYNRGWILKIKLAHPEEWDSLLSANDYRQLIT